MAGSAGFRGYPAVGNAGGLADQHPSPGKAACSAGSLDVRVDTDPYEASAAAATLVTEPRATSTAPTAT